MTNLSRHVSIATLRAPGEKLRLWLGVAITLMLLLVFADSYPGIFVAGLVAAFLMVRVSVAKFFGDSVKVSETQFSEIHRLTHIAASRLGMEAPEVFISYAPVLNAFSIGFAGVRAVVLHSALVEAFSQEQLLFVIGHELGHIKARHSFWSILTGHSLEIPVLSRILSVFFLSWDRKKEYTADRAGLIACHDLEAACRSMTKFTAGPLLADRVNLGELLRQKSRNSFFSYMAELLVDHPFPVNRIQALVEFHASDTYRTALMFENLDSSQIRPSMVAAG
ncbi:MAG: M48 family metallopeptidase [Oligoflexia bacterium]|nr:M48 family metallopeptidase [Oligoflexia bacterium]